MLPIKMPLRTDLSYEKEKAIETLITRCGANVNSAVDEYGGTPIFYAVWNGKPNLVEKLIKCGADVNASDNDDKTALFYAVWNGNESMVQTLIMNEADIDARDKDGKTALFYAVRQQREKLVKKLIASGADVNATSKNGRTALFYAVWYEDENMVKTLLIKCGADINATNKYDKTALFYAVYKENEEMIKQLINNRADINARDVNGRTVLFYAVQKDNQSVVRVLIDSGADVNIADNEGKTSLTYAVEWNCKSVVRELIDAGAEVDVRDHYGRTPLFYAMTQSPFLAEVTQRLIQLGANPNTTDSDGNTALHHVTQLALHGVTQESVMEICQQLKKLNVSLNIPNHENETPLIYCLTRTIKKVSGEEEPWPAVKTKAALKTQAAVCRFLIEHGSSVEAKTRSGEIVLHLALKLLQQGFFKRNSELSKAILDVALGLLEVITKHNISTNAKDNHGNTPLHLWARLQLAPGQDYSRNINKEYTFKNLARTVLALILQKKEQLNSKNIDEETPLHLCGTWTAVELLLDAGANPNDVDSSGRTPLLVAARNNKSVRNQGSLYHDIFSPPDKFWRNVLMKGLDPWTVDIENGSLLSVLIESGSHDLAKAVIDVACEDIKVKSRPLILFPLLNAICKDELPNAQWKKEAAELILSSTKCPVNGNAKEDSPLHYCCRNIVKALKSSSIKKVEKTVHWSMVKLLRSFGADYRIPDAKDQSCLVIADKCPSLKDILMEPIDLDRFPVLIKLWKSVSKTHERCLAKVARHLESEAADSYWYHKDHLASGSFGAVFAGISEKDGREVAIKRIEKIRMQRPKDKREITNLTKLADCEQVLLYLHFFEDKHFFYIVLELMEGNLEEFLDTAIRMDIKVSFCQDVVKGIQFLHEQNIIHQDLKPMNILYKTHPKLCLKIADFGLSRRIDSTSTTVYGTNAGTRCWIAPEVLKATKAHSKSSDMFACGLVLHYILSGKKHPFTPSDCANKSDMQIAHETEANLLNDKMEGWDDSLCPEGVNLLKAMLNGDESKRLSADKALAHPFFWSKKKKLDLLNAVGNQPEFGFSRAGRTRPVVELIRFIRNAYAHVTALPKPIQDQLLKHYVFLEYFPNLVMEVYKAVTTHGWDQRQEITHVFE